jgi:DNA helicase-2/ATP-dependent DNA helicase PcrA
MPALPGFDGAMAREYRLKAAPARASGIDYASELNPQQLEAVTSPPGHALVIAGAGSGKTRTLTYRVAYLLDNGIAPDNILLLTFTNKAAREMLERVRELVPVETRRLWGGTFHSIGNRILRHHANEIGFRPGFSIMDREDQKALMDAVVAAHGPDTASFRMPKPDVMIEMFSLAENTLRPLEEVVESRFPYFWEAVDEIARLREAYEEKKRDTNCMDFDDLLSKFVRLLRENEDARERFQRQFQFVLVDEFQDTNLLQCEFVDLLVGPAGNLMVVGDDAQSIYSWRGADVGHILGFAARHPGARVHKIEVNYRSVPEVLELANAVIGQNQDQIRKELRAARPGGGLKPALVTLDDPTAQAAFVGQRILELVDEGREFREIAVIYRAHYHSLDIQMELTARGIPFQITSGLRFFEQAHVKDVAAFMKFILNPTDEVSFTRMVKLAPGIGSAAAGKMWRQWMDSPAAAGGGPKSVLHDTLHSLKVPGKAAGVWEQFAWTLEELVDENGKPAPPPMMIRSIVDGVYLDYMRTKFDNAELRQQDLEQLGEFSERFDDAEEFLAQLTLLSSVDTENKPGRDDEPRDAVTLTTAHQAKGLEWGAVFSIWLADGMFPNNRALESGDEEEERRLFYVSVTRAKDELYLTYPLIWRQARDGDVLQRPSRFLADLDSSLYETWSVRGGW